MLKVALVYITYGERFYNVLNVFYVSTYFGVIFFSNILFTPRPIVSCH